MLPGRLLKLSRIEDPRQPFKVKHKMTVLMMYGILLYVYQIGSRRNANKDMSTPIFLSNVQAVFPEFESIPHADTLARLLAKIDCEKIQDAMVEMLKDLMKKKKFKKHLINKRYLVAVDGTQKFFKDYQRQEEALKCNVGGEAKIPQFYVYALDSVLVLDNGIVLPVLTEILDNKDWIEGETKKDCERKAFKRLAPKLCRIFGKGNITLLGDVLYACGPVIKIYREYNWDFMIVLKEDGLKDVWKEATGLMRLEPENSLRVDWGNRQQEYRWANDIEYEYGLKRNQTEIIHVVICFERWEENHSRSTKEIETKDTRYAWISSKKLSEKNVFKRCTTMARYRWKIENNFLIEKHEGYFFEHCYSYNWQAMKGFHYLMKIGHFLNALVINSEIIADYVDESGIRGFIKKLFFALAGAVLDRSRIISMGRKQHLWKLKVE
ncbi:MAG: transposase family protein [Chitinophagaceae bacterium]|nr:transposase family protein [Chitinophagaceae bacterium]